tara:strand:+ start:1928 stop:2632 length:705 start_codon:yes stop_codon:yes gene_type:complete
MAKNIKWIQVDVDTQVSIAITPPKTGAANPTLTDLVEQFDWGQYRYGTVADSVTVDNSNFIFEINDGEYIADIVGKINEYVDAWKAQAYDYEIDLRKKELGTYADSVYASASGYKYDAAVAFISSATPNAGLTTEAFYRGTTVGTLAAKIKTNHEAYITNDAKISGLRGMIIDRIDGINAGLDTSTVIKALESYAGIHTSEKVGERTTGVGTTEDIMVGVYNPSGLSERFDATM